MSYCRCTRRREAIPIAATAWNGASNGYSEEGPLGSEYYL